MSTATVSDNVATQTVTTTLFDLIDTMQQNATNDLQDALIVPTVAQWIRTGQITFTDDLTQRRPAA